MAGGLVREDLRVLGRLALRIGLALAFVLVFAAALGAGFRIFRIFAGLD